MPTPGFRDVPVGRFQTEAWHSQINSQGRISLVPLVLTKSIVSARKWAETMDLIKTAPGSPWIDIQPIRAVAMFVLRGISGEPKPPRCDKLRDSKYKECSTRRRTTSAIQQVLFCRAG